MKIVTLLLLLSSISAQANDSRDKVEFRILGEYMYRVNQCPKHIYTTSPSGCKWTGDELALRDCVIAYYHANIGQGESSCERRARDIKNKELRGLK